jgi:hypothetical protein
MTKIKLNTNREIVSSEEIKGRRDFSKLMTEYKTVSKPFYKNTYFVAGASAIVGLAIFSVVYFNTSVPKTELQVSDTSETKTERPFIVPAFSNLDIPFETYFVNAKKGGVLKLKNGSFIKIPANTFKDEKGQLVSGNVDIRYREFRDAVDILVSGIPMQYDSAGQKNQLESAGMFEIQGIQNGKKVALAKDIIVEMASSNASGNFNQYFLDTLSRSWKYLGENKIVGGDAKDESVVGKDSAIANLLRREMPLDDGFQSTVEENELAVSQNKIQELNKQTNALKKEEPVKPIKSKVDNYHFDLDVLPEEFPELVDYKGLQFEVGPENKTFNAGLYEIMWDDVKLNYNTPGKNYKINFVKNNKSSEFIVYPVYQGKDSVKVKALYQKKFVEYQKKLNEKIAAEKKAQEEMVLKQKKWEEKVEAQQKKFDEEQRKFAEQELKRSKAVNNFNIRNVFMVSQFGVYNTDRCFKFENEVRLTSYFADDDNKQLKVEAIYHIDADINTLISHYPYGLNGYEFNYNQKSTNTLFAITSKNEVLVFSPEQFSKITPEKGKYTFKLKKVEKAFANIEELRDHLLRKKN